MSASANSAIRRSAAARKRLRGKFPADRDERLRACLSDLSDTAAPVNAQVRSGPLTGRSIRNEDAIRASAALQAERGKVRGMLRRASGGPRSRSKSYRRASFRASLGEIVRRTNTIENELDHALPQHRLGTAEYRREAEDLIARIDKLQLRLTTRRAQVRYWANTRQAWGRITPRDKALGKKAVETARRLSSLRLRAKRAVAVPIDIGFKRAPAAGARKRRRWTEEDAYMAMVRFTRDHGRPPKARDFPNNPSLPSYAKVHALLGGIPEAIDLHRDAKNANAVC